MKIRYLIAISCLFATAAKADGMSTYVWDPGCNHTMTTNHFILSPNQGTQQIYIDLSACSDEQIGSLLFFGYQTTKTRSRQLTAKDNVSLSMTALDSYGNTADNVSSSSGSILADIVGTNSRGCLLTARNDGRKEIKIRLRAQLIAP